MHTYSVLVERNVEAIMDDGVILRSVVYRPEAEAGQRFPVLLTRTPYGQEGAGAPGYFNPVEVASSGYMVVVQDCRGRFSSEGSFSPSSFEVDDGFRSVEWAASLPQSDGQVAMWGRSYFAETQWRAALNRPRSLKALALGVSAGGNANNGSLYRGGAVEFGSRFGWGHMTSLHEIQRKLSGKPASQESDMEVWRTAEAQLSAGTLLDKLPMAKLSAVAGDFARREIIPSLAEGPGATAANTWDEATNEPVDLPTLHVGGWFDIFLPSTLEQYQQQLGRSRYIEGINPRLVIGPWSHSNFSGLFPDKAFGLLASAATLGSGKSIQSLHVAWFDAVLKSQPTALEGFPPVLLYLMGANEWRGFKELPTPQTTRSWYLAEDGKLLDSPQGSGTNEYDYDPLDPVPTQGGATMLPGAYFPGPANQQGIESRPDVITFTSDEFSEAEILFGTVKATLYVQSSAPDTDFIARLCVVNPAGISHLLVDGITRASWRGSIDEEGKFSSNIPRSPLDPQTVYEITVGLWSTAYEVQPGDRLRLQITSSCHPRWDRNPNTGEVAYSASHPIVAHQRIHSGHKYPSRITTGILN